MPDHPAAHRPPAITRPPARTRRSTIGTAAAIPALLIGAQGRTLDLPAALALAAEANPAPA